MSSVPDNTPILVGVGEHIHRSKDPQGSLEPLALMQKAIEAAAADAGATALLARIDSLDVVSEYSWPYTNAPKQLSERMGIRPARQVYGVAGGESPVAFVHDAALRITRGETRVAAVTGAESRYTVDNAAKAGVTLDDWTPRDTTVKLTRGTDYLHPTAVKLGVAAPITIYPFYENATQAAWGLSPRQAIDESARLWSRYSEVAAQNPSSWLKKTFTPDEVAVPTPSNRLIAWPYPKHMVANPLVNMGAAVIVTSVGVARELGIPQDKWVYIWGGAAAKEPRDYLERDQFQRSHAQDVVMEKVLALAGGDASAFEMLELYSCFPVVPKMARRTLGLAADAKMTSTGGLSFFGAPLNNYMTHAAAGLVRALRSLGDAGRSGEGKLALLYGQGGFVTKHHALLLGSVPGDPALLTPDYSLQDEADARRGPVPAFITEYTGPATLETFTVVYGRDGQPTHGVVIGRNPAGQRLMAKVNADDTATLAALTHLDTSPIGSAGEVVPGSDDLLHWTSQP